MQACSMADVSYRHLLAIIREIRPFRPLLLFYPAAKLPP